jgi:hypothetical protein
LVAGYLQDLGSILYFTNTETKENNKTKETSKSSSEIGDMVILDMRWLMRVFTSVTGEYKSIIFFF